MTLKTTFFSHFKVVHLKLYGVIAEMILKMTFLGAPFGGKKTSGRAQRRKKMIVSLNLYEMALWGTL